MPKAKDDKTPGWFQREVDEKLVTKTELRWEFSRFEEKITTTMKQYHNENLTLFDKVMTQISEMRQEIQFGIVRDERLDEKIENHEKRITVLEKAA